MNDQIKNKSCEILKRYPVRRAAFFGSVLTDRFGDNSDVDLLVEFFPGTRGLDFFGLKVDLEEELCRPVDLITFNSLNKANPGFKKAVEQEAVVIYDRAGS